ncbi:uncharacterized protein LOC121866831 [Homarus americanus]|uniref:uncharacterized protein LOC121866831 n=1 Tax=Homarus americanus TaxID=6706 RepID=UPI001C456870|nr:uncharacterized protein LOC121866831 [Homarus americanus]
MTEVDLAKRLDILGEVDCTCVGKQSVELVSVGCCSSRESECVCNTTRENNIPGYSFTQYGVCSEENVERCTECEMYRRDHVARCTQCEVYRTSHEWQCTQYEVRRTDCRERCSRWEVCRTNFERCTQCEIHRTENVGRCTQCGVYKGPKQNRTVFLNKYSSLHRTVRQSPFRTVADESSDQQTTPPPPSLSLTPSSNASRTTTITIAMSSLVLKSLPSPALSPPEGPLTLTPSSTLPSLAVRLPSSTVPSFSCLTVNTDVASPPSPVVVLTSTSPVGDLESHTLPQNVIYTAAALPYPRSPNTAALNSITALSPCIIHTAGVSTGASCSSAVTNVSYVIAVTLPPSSPRRPVSAKSVTVSYPTIFPSDVPSPAPAALPTPTHPNIQRHTSSTPPPQHPHTRNDTPTGFHASTPRRIFSHIKRKSSTREHHLPRENSWTSQGSADVQGRRSLPPSGWRSRWRLRGSLMDGHLIGAIVVLMAVIISSASSYELKPTTTVSRVVLAGLTARLPCELPLPPDRPTLILWYRNQATKPFYSFDARNSTTGRHKYYDDSPLGQRSKFKLETFQHNFQARLGSLEVESISRADAGNYTCRVDFMTSQTMMSLLHLTVHEDIHSLQVFDAYENTVGEVAGPYKLSSRVMLSCRAYGGYPLPVVNWLSGEELLGSSLTQPSSTATHRTRGRGGNPPMTVVSVMLHLPSLNRENNGQEVTCVATNTNLTQGKSLTIKLDMYLPPLEVSVEGVEKPLRAEVEAGLLCRAAGSRPPAALTWNITQSTALTPLPAQTSLDRNTTVMRGRLLPSSQDHGQTLTCVATNQQVPEYFLVASHTLNVLFSPEVEAHLAPALDPSNIKEGEDVYFECHIKANPPESRVLWLHQGEPLHTDRERGVLAQGRNLVLQKVNRRSRGHYQCQVTNAVATVTSNTASLDVMFAPECRDPRNLTVSVTATEEVNLECVVEANPPPMDFLWKVNNSRGELKDIEPTSYNIRGRTSTLVYRPDSQDIIRDRPHTHDQPHPIDHTHEYAHDSEQEQYGVVFCQGKNRLGIQEEPCMFIITPAGPPEEPESCSLVNQSATSLGVSCVPGHDGGLSQTFLAFTVRDAGSQEVVAKVSSPTPTFTVGGLASGRDYLVLVTATNTKGQSPPYVIHGFALKVAENKINNSSSAESSPLLVVFVGAVSGFVFILTVLGVATRSRCRRRRMSPDVSSDTNKPREEVPLSPLSPDSALDEASGEEEVITEVNPQVTEPQTPESPTSGRSSQTYVPDHTALTPAHTTTSLPRPHRHPHPQPLHSVDLPHITSNNHKYYTLKINCTRQNNESFV